MIKYMHTMDGRPASYDPETQMIWLAGRHWPVRLARSWQQIRSEQRKNRLNCLKSGVALGEYGYARVEVS